MRMRVRDCDYSRHIPWYYGVAYYDISWLEAVLYPIPINFLVRWVRSVRDTWNRFRGAAPRWIPESAINQELMRRETLGRELGSHEADQGVQVKLDAKWREGYDYAFKVIGETLTKEGD